MFDFHPSCLASSPSQVYSFAVCVCAFAIPQTSHDITRNACETLADHAHSKSDISALLPADQLLAKISNIPAETHTKDE